MTPYLRDLHFLPITYRTQFKINVLVYKCLNNQAPNYLRSLLVTRLDEHNRQTRKDNDITWLNQPPLEKLNYKCRGFKYTAPITWNKLSFNIRDSPTLDCFKIRLKTFYFKEWLNQ